MLNDVHSAHTVHLHWSTLSKHLEEQIQELRERNDGDHDPIRTAWLRGQIEALKGILALANPPARGEGVDPG